MPQFPFYYDKKDSELTVHLTDEEERHRRQDWESIKSSKAYRKKFEDKWRLGAQVYNLVQTAPPNDRVSNFTIGLARMIIDTGISMMTEGQPEFDFAPLGPSDNKKIILWKALIKMLLSRCNYRSHQDKFITDFHVFGTGVYEVYTQLPYRTKRCEVEGKIEEKLVRDFRRTKVGVRHISPFHCWRNPNVSDPDDVPTAGKEELMTWNQFVQNYGNVYVLDHKGDKVRKYKNVDQLQKGTHVKVTPHYDEIQDAYRVYAVSYGTEVDGTPEPPEEIGIPIFDKPLSITRTKGFSSGANVQGMTPLCFGTNNDQYDSNGKTHALYGMGIPELIEGPEDILTTLFNMDIDNARLYNTPLIYEKPNGESPSRLNSDIGPRYAGDYVDNEISVQYLAQSRFGENSLRYEFINNLCIWLTGINFQQLGGDSSKTAFEFAQRIRANNQRAEKRIRTLENGCLKRMATLLLSNALSELTVDEWEDLTEEQAEAIAKRISSNEVTGEDYDLTQKKRRVLHYIPVEGKNYVEDFKSEGHPRKRQLDPSKTNNTLREEKSTSSSVSYVPLVGAYVYPTEYIESGLLPDVIVDGKRMLGDLKVQEAEMVDNGIRLGIELAQVDPNLAKELDLKKQYTARMKIAGLEERDLYKGQDKGSEILEDVKNLADSILNPTQDELSLTAPVPAPQANPAGPGTLSGARLAPPPALERTAAGAL
jgi:hypothetical protein